MSRGKIFGLGLGLFLASILAFSGCKSKDKGRALVIKKAPTEEIENSNGTRTFFNNYYYNSQSSLRGEKVQKGFSCSEKLKRFKGYVVMAGGSMAEAEFFSSDSLEYFVSDGLIKKDRKGYYFVGDDSSKHRINQALVDSCYAFSIQNLEDALSESKTIDYKGAEGMLYYYIAKVHESKGDTVAALEYLNHALKSSKKINDHHGVALSFYARANLNGADGNFKQIISDLEEGLGAEQSSYDPDKEFILAIYENMVYFYVQHGSTNKANEASKKASELREELAKPITSITEE